MGGYAVTRCITSVIIMIGLLGLIGWKVTVISSNFIASDVDFKYGNEHSCYCSFFAIKKGVSTIYERGSYFRSKQKMMLPILYTVLTTICAFLSLVFSGIKPIIDFGWMMTLGLVVSIVCNIFIVALINQSYSVRK